MRSLFQQLTFADCSTRVEAVRRSADRLSLVSCILAVLMWIWAQSPGFDLVPAILNVAFRVASVLTYGLVVPPVGSFVGSAATSINLGNAIVFGPLVLALLMWGWYAAERRLAVYTSWLIRHPEHRKGRHDTIRQLRAGARSRMLTLAFRGVLVVAACLVLMQRFTDLRSAPPQDFVASTSKCRSGVTWVEPWPGAETSVWTWWFPPSEWCADTRKDAIWSFRSVLPHRFFEDQLNKRAEHPNVEVSPFLQALAARDPYDGFPYVFPAPTMWVHSTLTLVIGAAVIVICRLRANPLGVMRTMKGVRRMHWSRKLRIKLFGATLVLVGGILPAAAEDIRGHLTWCAGNHHRPAKGKCMQAIMPDGQQRGIRSAGQLIEAARSDAVGGNCAGAATWASACQCHNPSAATAILKSPAAVCAFFGK